MRAFLSHSSKDKGLVESVARALGGANIELDSLTFDFGVPNAKAIQDALKRSTLFVLFLSADADASNFVEYERIQAEELVARGLIGKLLIICLDVLAFNAIQDDLKKYNIVRRVSSVQTIVRLVQHHLIVANQREDERQRPFVGRLKELNEAKNQLVDPLRPPTKSIFVSGNAGIGRRTFSRKLYSEVFPYVSSIFPEVYIDMIDGLDEIYRKLLEVYTPVATRAALRAVITDFSLLNEDGKVQRITSLMSKVVDGRETLFLIDRGGLLDDLGGLSDPLRLIHSKLPTFPHPSIVFVAERMMPRLKRDTMQGSVFCPIPTLSAEESRQLVALMLKREQISYTNEDLEQLVEISDLHPFNIEFIVASAKQYTLAATLDDTSELIQWKRRRSAEFLQRVQFSDAEIVMLSILRDFRALDFGSLATLLEATGNAAGPAVMRLLEYHILEVGGDTFSISPPLRSAVERDGRFTLPPAELKKIMRLVSDMLTTSSNEDETSMSMIEAGILASLQGDGAVPDFLSVFLLPSQEIWLARRRYDERRHADCIALVNKALQARERLSKAGVVEACRLLCLASARLRNAGEFNRGIAMLEQLSSDTRAKSSVHFLRGFSARLKGYLPEAERELRLSTQFSPGNFSAVRELAHVCRARGNFDAAETFARKAYDIAPDNPYIIDILLTILLNQHPAKQIRDQNEIDFLFDKLKQFGEDDDHSFYTARRAEFEMRKGNLPEAANLIDLAARRTPGIFSVHVLRARIYLDRGNKAVASEELKKMQGMIDDPNSGEGRSGLRDLLELKADYLVSNGEHNEAKRLYEAAGVFSDEEKSKAIRGIDFDRAGQ